VLFHETADGRAVALLNERERGLLARIAMRVHFRRGATIYREGDPADFVYNIAAGVVKAFRTLTGGRRRIVAFLFGLAVEGVYVNLAEAVTAVTAYRISLPALDNLVRTDPALDYSLLLKLTHELRAAQCHALILARHDAIGRIAMFIAMLQRLQQERGMNGDDIPLPMSRSDIADYVGMPLSTVSRSFRSLIAGNIVRFTDRRRLRIIDRARFEELLSQPARGREAEP
jgi:CRP/FNR family transcriptional regulator